MQIPTAPAKSTAAWARPAPSRRPSRAPSSASTRIGSVSPR